MDDFGGGTQFEFTYAPGTSTEQIIGFEMAGEIWSSYLTDDVTVRIHVESTSELPDELVGAALPGKKIKEKYDKIYDALETDITSSSDSTAFANLPSEDKEFSVLIDGQQLNKTKEFRITNANAKSLGLLNDDRQKLDGYIVVNDLSENSAVGWDYDALRSDGIEGDKIDFLSVAMHEVGHVLGFVSGVDDSDWLKVLTESQKDDDKDQLKDKDFKFVSPLDLYRYSDSTAASGQIDLSYGGNPFFSIDGGRTKIGSFANGQYTDFGGDGYQASHWEQFSSQGIMDPVLPIGLRKDISSLDVTSMDAIGWDVNTATAPSWDEMYASAVADANSVTIEDREKDVEKMIQESKYEVRRARGVKSRIYSWQIGLWQYTTFDSTDVSELVTVEEFSEPTDADDTNNNSTDNPPETVNEDLAENSSEITSGDSSTIDLDTNNSDNTDGDSTYPQPESELLETEDSSSDSEVVPTNGELIDSNTDSELVDLDNPPTSNLENDSVDDRSEAVETSSDNNFSNSDNAAENEPNITNSEANQTEADEQLSVTDDDNFNSSDEQNNSDANDNDVSSGDYWQSDLGGYLPEPQQSPTGVAYYAGEQDSLIS